MPSIRQQLRYAVRSLRRSASTSCFSVGTLAICIGAVAAVYSVADVVLVRGLPFDHPDQLVWVSSVTPERPDAPFSLPEFLDYRAQTKSVRIAGYASWIDAEALARMAAWTSDSWRRSSTAAPRRRPTWPSCGRGTASCGRAPSSSIMSGAR